jgi:hypothetical protein
LNRDVLGSPSTCLLPRNGYAGKGGFLWLKGEKMKNQVQLSGQAEMYLYRESPEVWALVKVMQHSPKRKQMIWDSMDSDEKALVKVALQMKRKNPPE